MADAPPYEDAYDSALDNAPGEEEIHDDNEPEDETTIQDSHQNNFFAEAAFENADIREMADAIDSFRAIGLTQDIALPQIVVIGDQTAGKSSLLENLTHLPFPVGSGTCTRFAVEVALRRGPVTTVEASVVRSKDPKHRKKNFTEWSEKFGSNFDQKAFADLFARTSKDLGVQPPGTQRDNGSDTNKVSGIAGEMLRIEASSPNFSMLSFVDTPGLFHSGSDETSEKDAPLVKGLVRRLTKDDRTIIVAVMDARLNIESQEAFKIAKDVDKEGTRTVGVLTKVDAVQKGDEESTALKVANNISRPLSKGWFLVKNQSSIERQDPGKTFDSIQNSEDELFSRAPWNRLRSDQLGSSQLRNSLTELFSEHVKREFPKIQQEIFQKRAEALSELERLGRPRSNPNEQREYLLNAVVTYEQVTDACANGRRSNVLSGNEDDRSKIWLQRNKTLSRFQNDMDQKGCRRKFISVSEESFHTFEADAGRTLEELHSDIWSGRKGQHTDSIIGSPYDENIYKWINRQYHEVAVPACIGLPRTDLVQSLFECQITPWQEISGQYLHSLMQACRDLIDFALDTCCTNTLVSEALRERIFADIESFNTEARTRVSASFQDEILRMHTCEPQLQSAVASKEAQRLAIALKPVFASPDVQNWSYPKIMESLLNNPTPFTTYLSHPRDLVFRIHDMLECYYGFAKNRFVDKITQIGDGLILQNPNLFGVFNREWVTSLSVEELEAIAGEDPKTAAQRRRLNDQIARFDAAIARVEEIIPRLRGYRRHFQGSASSNVADGPEVKSSPDSKVNDQQPAGNPAIHVQNSSSDQNLTESNIVSRERTNSGASGSEILSTKDDVGRQTLAPDTSNYSLAPSGSQSTVTPVRQRSEGSRSPSQDPPWAHTSPSPASQASTVTPVGPDTPDQGSTNDLSTSAYERTNARRSTQGRYGTSPTPSKGQNRRSPARNTMSQSTANTFTFGIPGEEEL